MSLIFEPARYLISLYDSRACYVDSRNLALSVGFSGALSVRFLEREPTKMKSTGGRAEALPSSVHARSNGRGLDSAEYQVCGVGWLFSQVPHIV